ncbi:hypothetical protein Hanom_Chr00s209971g01840291 [Helianthus anomalus]
MCLLVCPKHTACVFIHKHSRSGRRIRQNDRKIICRTVGYRRIHVYLEGWYILRGSEVSFVDIFRAHRRIDIILRWLHLSTQTLYKHISNCLTKSNQEDG